MFQEYLLFTPLFIEERQLKQKSLDISVFCKKQYYIQNKTDRTGVYAPHDPLILFISIDK